MQRKNKVLIKIHGQEYPIVGAESKEYLLKVGSYVDEKMEEVAAANKRLSTSMVAVLTSINIVDQFFKLQEAYETLQKQQAAPMDELENLKVAYNNSIAQLVEKDNIIAELTEKLEQLKVYEGNEEELVRLRNELEERTADLKKAEEMINDLQNKLFESQIKLVEIRRQMEEMLQYSEGETQQS